VAAAWVDGGPSLRQSLLHLHIAHVHNCVPIIIRDRERGQASAGFLSRRPLPSWLWIECWGRASIQAGGV